VFSPSPCILHQRERLFLCSQASKTDMATTSRRGRVMMSVVMDAEEGVRESLGGQRGAWWWWSSSGNEQR
jgi:hypothetical protein